MLINFKYFYLASKIYKKFTGTKDKIVGSEQDDFDIYGRRIFIGNIKKLRGNIQGDVHKRWVVMRGWQLYWYRQAGDTEQKGILTLPS